MQKKERSQYPAILIEQAWSIKDLVYYYGIKNTRKRSFGKTFLLDTVSNPELATQRNPASRITNHKAAFGLFFSLTELAI